MLLLSMLLLSCLALQAQRSANRLHQKKAQGSPDQPGRTRGPQTNLVKLLSCCHQGDRQVCEGGHAPCKYGASFIPDELQALAV
jgi:hypothetical protein